MNEFTDRFEEGLDTVIGERGVKLSGGQRQRISIARALLANPKIIILDEATSNLDAKTEEAINNVLVNKHQHLTSIIIAHRLSTIRRANKIIVIDQGEIKEIGSHEELLATKGEYYSYYSLWLSQVGGKGVDLS